METGIPATKDSKIAGTASYSPLESTGTAVPFKVSQSASRRLNFHLPRSWAFWTVVTILVSGSAGFIAVAMLLKLPAAPNCPTIFLPTVSASMRFYCAELAASHPTVNNLLQAIDLVDDLPEHHPLRAESDRYIQQWSGQLLVAAEKSYQSGDLLRAIAIAQRIPASVAAHQLAKKRIKSWSSTWKQAEAYFDQTNDYLRQSNLDKALRQAAKLSELNNHYWGTTKYNELINLLQITRTESETLDNSLALLRTGQLDSLLEAVKLAESIKSSSYVYRKAKALLKQCSISILKHVLSQLDQGNSKSANSIINKISTSLKLQTQVADLRLLVSATSKATGGTIDDLEAAINNAKELDATRPYYRKAQQLIAKWQLEIEDVARLNQARKEATPGRINDLIAAISQAQQVQAHHPRFREATAMIGQWQHQIQVIEDRPYLDGAKQIASYGGVEALADAINQANFIRPGRALYPEAKSRIRQWINQIERLQDQPVLDEARLMASYGTPEALDDGIATASKIRPGRALFTEAQTAINNWSYQLLAIAQQLAASDPTTAIAIAQIIPPSTEVYAQAQAQIQLWAN